MSTDDGYKEMLADARRERERLRGVKAILCEALKAKRIANVSIAYDGEGDSGQVNDIQALDAEKQPVALDEPIELALHKPNEPTKYTSLHEALDDYAWTVLQAYHDGFVDNDGGYGTITINVAEGAVTIDHNDRVTDVETTVTEV